MDEQKDLIEMSRGKFTRDEQKEKGCCIIFHIVYTPEEKYRLIKLPAKLEKCFLMVKLIKFSYFFPHKMGDK